MTRLQRCNLDNCTTNAQLHLNMLKTCENRMQVHSSSLHNYATQSYQLQARHPDYLLLHGHTTLLNTGGCLRKNKIANEFWNCVQERLERKIPGGAKTTVYQLRQVSRLLATRDN